MGGEININQKIIVSNDINMVYNKSLALLIKIFDNIMHLKY